MPKKPINRLKVVRVGQAGTSKWLAEQLDKNETTVSRWCANEVKPNLDTLPQIAALSEIDLKEL